MTLAIATLHAMCTHGATVITGSPDHDANNLAVARLGDLVACPLPGHGINPIVAVQVTQESDNKLVAHVAAIAACGAMIITASPDVYVG